MRDVTIQAPAQKTISRLLSLDVLRGITIAFMILVNNEGDGPHTYRLLKHAEWNGWTPCDLVFPSFLFIAGTAIVFSTDSRRGRGESEGSLILHAFRRAIILFLLGLVVNGFPHFSLPTLRIYGVLQRIAICYFIGTVLYVLKLRVSWMFAGIAGLLLGYWILMRYVPIPGYGVPTHGFPLLDRDTNWVAFLDRKIFPGRLYERVRDPEGLLSNIPALATLLLGVLAGQWLRRKQSPQRTVKGLFLSTVCGLALGKLWNIWFPINKKLWTSSYVLFAAGWTLLILTVCYWLIEVKQWKRGWTSPWIIFGSNAIVAYVFSELFASSIYSVHVQSNGHIVPLQSMIYVNYFSSIANLSLRSLVYSLSYVLVCFVPIAILYRKKVFIKL
jgi:predicted acyltransferase